MVHYYKRTTRPVSVRVCGHSCVGNLLGPSLVHILWANVFLRVGIFLKSQLPLITCMGAKFISRQPVG